MGPRLAPEPPALDVLRPIGSHRSIGLLRLLGMGLVTVLVAGCGSDPKPSPAPAPPEPTTAGTELVEATDDEPLPREPEDAGPPPPPTTPVRLMLRAPTELQALEKATLRDVRATVTVDGDVAADMLPVEDLETAREGVGILVLVVARSADGDTPGPAITPGQYAVADALFDRMRAHDRVAVGAITAGGFELIRGFSADVRSAAATLRLAVSGPASEKPTPLLRGLHEALDAFLEQRHLPDLRAMVVVTDGEDATIRRPSVRSRLFAAVQLRAFVHRVRLHIVGETPTAPAEPAGNPDAPTGDAAARLRDLAVGSGGQFVAADPAEAGAYTRAGRAIEAELRRWVVVDAALEAVAEGEHDVQVTLAGPAGERSAKRRIILPPPGRLRAGFDLEIPGPPARIMPVGVESPKAIAAAAQRADDAGDRLLAGVLWHLAHQANPEARGARERADTLDDVHQKAESGFGTLQWRGEALPLDVAVTQATTDQGAIWRETLGRETSIDNVLLPIPPLPEGGAAPEPTQKRLVFHRCQAWTTADCLHRLLAAGTSTHFVVDVAGRIVQTNDLARELADPAGQARDAVHLHLVMPPDPALTFQDLQHPESLRHVRRFVDRAEINDIRMTGWQPTAAQHRALVPLIRGLTRHLPGLRAVIPIDQDQHPVRGALREPNDFAGLMSASNFAKAIAHDPGPGIPMTALAEGVQRWSWRGTSTDLEQWLPDLADPKRRDAAIARFTHVGPVAVPLLREVAQELTPTAGLGAVQALEAIGDGRAMPTLLALLKHPVTTPDGLTLRLAVLSAMVRLLKPDDTAPLKAADEALEALGSLPQDRPDVLTARRWTTALFVAAGTAGVPYLLPRLTDADRVIRAQATLGVGAFATEAERTERLTPLMSDSEPWIRLLAARALPGSGQKPIDTVLALAEPLGPEWPVAALQRLNAPPAAWTRVADWLFEGAPAARILTSDALAAHPSVEIVRRLAPQLENALPSKRRLLLRTLKKLTGRDFGSAPDGYLRWRPAGAK